MKIIHLTFMLVILQLPFAHAGSGLKSKVIQKIKEKKPELLVGKPAKRVYNWQHNESCKKETRA